MAHLGDFDASTVVYGKFATYRPSTGATFTLAGTPALSVYKDNSTTQSTTGVTLTADFDSVTGLNHFAIDTSADGTFYAAGSFFDIVITTGTVDSVSVTGSVVGSFTLRKTSALKPTTAARTLDVSAGGEAGIDWANVGSPTTAVNLSSTNIDVDQVVASVSGAVGSVTGAVGSVTGAVGSVTAAVTVGTISNNVITAASIAADAGAEIADAVWDEAIAGHAGAGSTGEALAAAGSAGDPWTTALPGAYGAGTAGKIIGDNINATISSRATQASVDDLPTNAELATALGTADDAVLTAIDALPTNAELATALGTADDAVLAQIALVKTETDKIASIKTKTDSLTFTKALELDVNLQSVNGTTITGDGQSGSEWGPA